MSYDKWRPNQGLVLDLQFRETTGTITQDWAKPYHADPTLVGTPAWAVLGNDLTYLSFDPTNPDTVQIAAADCADLDFTSGDFSGCAWFYPDASGERFIFNKGLATTGYAFGLQAGTYSLVFYTRQAGPVTQSSLSSVIAANTWQHVGFIRDGASVRLYINGVDETITPGTHVNPASSVAENLYIGSNDAAAAAWLDGRLWRPRIWNRALAAWELAAIYEAERDLFGV